MTSYMQYINHRLLHSVVYDLDTWSFTAYCHFIIFNNGHLLYRYTIHKYYTMFLLRIWRLKQVHRSVAQVKYVNQWYNTYIMGVCGNCYRLWASRVYHAPPPHTCNSRNIYCFGRPWMYWTRNRIYRDAKPVLSIYVSVPRNGELPFWRMMIYDSGDTIGDPYL
jgi:hypothetical protein